MNRENLPFSAAHDSIIFVVWQVYQYMVQDMVRYMVQDMVRKWSGIWSENGLGYGLYMVREMVRKVKDMVR